MTFRDVCGGLHVRTRAKTVLRLDIHIADKWVGEQRCCEGQVYQFRLPYREYELVC